METITVGTIEHLDPRTLNIEENVRPSAPLTDEFINSIRTHGILTPVLGYRDAHGRTWIRAGQRRTAAALIAELPTIPVYITDAATDLENRIGEQLIENDQREALTTGARAVALHQLTLAGLSEKDISRATGTPRAQIKKAIAVANSTITCEVVTQHALSLDQAAYLTEFEHDPDTFNELIETATTQPDHFPHALQRARDEQARRNQIAALTAQYRDSGYRILDYNDDDYNQHAETSSLIHADGTALTDEEIATNPDRAVRIYNPNSIRFYIKNPAKHGLRDRYQRTQTNGPMTDEQKAERRTLIENNKAWDSATTVRREWVEELLTRKKLPDNAPQTIAHALTAHHGILSTALSNNNPLAHEWLGLTTDKYWVDAISGYLADHPNRAATITLTITLAAYEAAMNRDCWRHPNTTATTYLEQLEAWGYTLSDVEALAAGRNQKEEHPE